MLKMKPWIFLQKHGLPHVLSSQQMAPPFTSFLKQKNPGDTSLFLPCLWLYKLTYKKTPANFISTYNTESVLFTDGQHLSPEAPGWLWLSSHQDFQVHSCSPLIHAPHRVKMWLLTHSHFSFTHSFSHSARSLSLSSLPSLRAFGYAIYSAWNVLSPSSSYGCTFSALAKIVYSQNGLPLLPYLNSETYSLF